MAASIQMEDSYLPARYEVCQPGVHARKIWIRQGSCSYWSELDRQDGSWAGAPRDSSNRRGGVAWRRRLCHTAFTAWQYQSSSRRLKCNTGFIQSNKSFSINRDKHARPQNSFTHANAPTVHFRPIIHSHNQWQPHEQLDIVLFFVKFNCGCLVNPMLN